MRPLILAFVLFVAAFAIEACQPPVTLHAPLTDTPA